MAGGMDALFVAGMTLGCAEDIDVHYPMLHIFAVIVDHPAIKKSKGHIAASGLLPPELTRSESMFGLNFFLPNLHHPQ